MGEIFGLVIVRPLGLILLAIFNFVGNYGIAVILFALLVKLCCMPLTIKSKKSMLKMTAMNAELQQLQKKYANNRVKLNEEMQKLYDKHGDVYKRQSFNSLYFLPYSLSTRVKAALKPVSCVPPSVVLMLLAKDRISSL